MTKDIIFLKKGLKIENVTLKNFISLSNEEMEIIRRIRNHPEVKKWMFSDHEITEKEHQKFIKSLKKDKQNLYFLVLQDNLYLGVIYLNRIDFKNRHAFLGLYKNPKKKLKMQG
jgi:UDP-4-amino-4,6-dideoxy-N-acetyl-beta-L-altrosamine N-acetyltransferase